MKKAKLNCASRLGAIETVRFVYILIITLEFLDICTGLEESAGSKMRIQGFKNNEKIQTLKSPRTLISYSVDDHISYTCVHDYEDGYWLSWKQEKDDIILVSYPGGLYRNSTINLKMDSLDDGSRLVCTVFEDASLVNIKDSLTVLLHEKAEDAISILKRKSKSDCKGLQDHVFKINDKKVEQIYNVTGEEDEIVCIKTDVSSHVTWAEYKRYILYMNKPNPELDIEVTTTLAPPAVVLTTQSEGWFQSSKGHETAASDSLNDEWRITFIVSISVLIPVSAIVGTITGYLCQKRLRKCINKVPIIYENIEVQRRSVFSQHTDAQRDIASRQTEDQIDISYTSSDLLPESIQEDSKEDQKQIEYDTPYDHIHCHTTHNGTAIIGDGQISKYETKQRLAANLFSTRFPTADSMPEHLVPKIYVAMCGGNRGITNNLKSRETEETMNKNEYYTPIQNYRNNLTGNRYQNV